MPEQYIRSFIRGDSGGEFLFEPERDGIPAEELTHAIPTGDTAGAHGEYQSDSYIGPRLLSMRIRLVAASPSLLQAAIDTFFKAFPVGAQGKLRRRIVEGNATVSDRYLPCRVSFRSKGPETGLPYVTAEVGFRAASPFYCDWLLQNPVNLTFAGGGGAKLLEIGGTESALPLIALTCATAGTVKITESAKGEWITLALTPGVYLIDMEAQRVTKGGVSALSAILAGGFFAVSPESTTITLLLTGGAVLSAATIQARRRWSFT